MNESEDKQSRVSHQTSKRSQKSQQPSVYREASKSQRNASQKQSKEIKECGINLGLDIEEYPVHEWEAAFIDQKYYLGDPASLKRLRQLQQQIEAQKQKLASIDDTENFDKSFLSHQHLQIGPGQKNPQILTEINESMLIERKQMAEADLLNEENRYRMKIEQMKKKKSELKREMGVGTNEKNNQTDFKIIKRQQLQKKKAEDHKSKRSQPKSNNPIQKQKTQRRSQKQPSHKASHKQPSHKQPSQKAQSKKSKMDNLPSGQKSEVQKSKNQNQEEIKSHRKSDRKSQIQLSEKPSEKLPKSQRHSQRKSSQKHPSVKGSERNSHMSSHKQQQKKSEYKGSSRKEPDNASQAKESGMKEKSERKSSSHHHQRSQKSKGHISERKSRKSSSKSKPHQQLGANLNLPEPSNRSSKIHSPFDSPNQDQSVRINVNYVYSEKNQTQSVANHNLQESKGKDHSDFKSQRGSHQPVNSEQISPSKKSDRNSHRSQSKKSALLDHIDKNKCHEEQASHASYKQSQHSVKRSEKSKPSKSHYSKKDEHDKQSQVESFKEKSRRQDKEKSVSRRSQCSRSQQPSERGYQQPNNQSITNQDYTVTNQDVTVTNQNITVTNQDITYQEGTNQEMTSQFVTNQDQSFTQQQQNSRMTSSYQSQSQQGSQYSQSQSKVSQSYQEESYYPTQKQSEAVYMEKKAGFIKTKKAYEEPDCLKKVDISIQWEQMQSSKDLKVLDEKKESKQQASKHQDEQRSQRKSHKSSHKQKSHHHPASNLLLQSQQPQLQKSMKAESQRKPRSFVIHSKQKSVKSKHKEIRSRSSRKESQEIPNEISKITTQSQNRKNKLQIEKLNNQMKKLQEKLQLVEEKQDTLIKYENNQSNIMNQIESSQAGSNSEVVSPLRKSNFQSKLRLQNKLSLEGSIVQFNVHEERQKMTAEENQRLQKLRLQQQIGRLKKIIRDMQMQKIKSIEHDPLLTQSRFDERKPIQLDENISRFSFNQPNKESLKSDFLVTKKDLWKSEVKIGSDDVGRILKNGSPEKSSLIQSPRKFNQKNAEKIKNFSENGQEEEDFEHSPLPYRKKLSETFSGRKNKELKPKEEYFNKFEENQKNFQNFLESSRMINEPHSQAYIDMSVQESYIRPEQHHIQMHTPSVVPEIETPSSMKKNINEIAERMKRENPEEQQIYPKQIQIGNIEIPQLPGAPTVEMNQNQLTELAKQTFAIFGKIIDDSDPNCQLSMKKYKNCVIFSLSGDTSECILWHYSGKFYIGGWKHNDASQGEKTGSGLQYIPGKHVYKGQFLGGKKNGTGILRTNNGNIYEGQWVDGVKNGRGVYLQANTKTIYSGEWKDGKRDGYGLLKFSETQFYEGTFQRSVKHGHGVEKFANGDIYKGQYNKGRFNGKGKYIWSNGSSYQGDFIDGARHGQGNWRSSRNGGDIYVGMYQNDKKCGYGRYVWANGCVYEGNFKDDLKNGKGRLIYQDGKQIKGTWEDGNLANSDGDIRKLNDHEQQPLRRSIRASSLRENPFPKRASLM